jgi:hypothetical protein
MTNSEFTSSLCCLQRLSFEINDCIQKLASAVGDKYYLEASAELGRIQQAAMTIPSICLLMRTGLYEISQK